MARVDMTANSDVFMLECLPCGSKITAGGKVFGGNEWCKHKYDLIFETPPSTVVIATDPQRNCMRIIDQNKKENEKHTANFMSDVAELDRLESAAMKEITSVFKGLRDKLYERQDELEDELECVFAERRDKIMGNLNGLQQHKSKNEETKEYCEDLLIERNEAESEREKIIIGGCENVINTTPNLKYTEIELKYAFDGLHRIKRTISQFGALVTKPIDSGMKCVFKSTLKYESK